MLCKVQGHIKAVKLLALVFNTSVGRPNVWNVNARFMCYIHKDLDNSNLTGPIFAKDCLECTVYSHTV